MGAEMKEGGESEPTTRPTASTGEMKNFQFKAPKDYNHLSQQEKEVMTKKMMAHWKGWAHLKTSKELG